MAKKMINIRLDEDLWNCARSMAVRQGETMQKWLTDAITFKMMIESKGVSMNTELVKEKQDHDDSELHLVKEGIKR